MSMVILSPPWDGAYKASEDILFALQFALHGAAIIAGELKAAPLSIPDSERDVPADQAAPFPYSVLADLAELWIITDDKDPRPKVIDSALPYVFRARPNAHLQVGGVYAKSVADALLKAAHFITQSLRDGFGCASLIQIVQKAYPRDLAADPWDFNLALAWLATLASGDIPLAVHLEESLSDRNEFLRRLYAFDLKAAVAAVRLQPLCEWLYQNYAAFNEPWLREALELEFLQATFPSEDLNSPKIRWDKLLRKLWYGKTVCKTYTRSAPQQELILDAFQELGWPDRIDDPLAKGRLADTINNLQRSLSDSPITFERDGTGKGIVWRKT